MEFLLTAATTFAGALLALGFIEVAAENLAVWNTAHVSGYFWSIEPDPNGSEAQRIAFELLGERLGREGMELCRILKPGSRLGG
jgi:hypothetical protein